MDAALISQAARDCAGNCLDWNNPRREVAAFVRQLVTEQGWNWRDALVVGHGAMRLLAERAGWTVHELVSTHGSGRVWTLQCTRGNVSFFVEGLSRQEALTLAWKQAQLRDAHLNSRAAGY